MAGTALAGLVLTSLAGLTPASARATGPGDCGPPTSGVVICTSVDNPYLGGISYVSPEDLTVQVENDVVIESVNPGLEVSGSGIKVITLFPKAGEAQPGVKITTTGPKDPGIASFLEGGRTTINAGDGSGIGTQGPSAPGIAAAVLGGDVTIDSSATIDTSGKFSPGIDGTSIGFGARIRRFGLKSLSPDTPVIPFIGVHISNGEEISTDKFGSAAIAGTAIALPGIDFDEPPYVHPTLPNHGVTILNNSELETAGNASAGIDALSIDVRVPDLDPLVAGSSLPTGGVYVENQQSGRIDTQGEDSHGIWAATATVSLGAEGLPPLDLKPRPDKLVAPKELPVKIEGVKDIRPLRSALGITEVVNYGDIATGGENAHGIFAGSLALDATLNIQTPSVEYAIMDKSLSTAPVIDILPAGDRLGGVNVFNNASIRTSGSSADGITGTSIVADLDVNVDLTRGGMGWGGMASAKGMFTKQANNGLAGGVFIRNEGSIETGTPQKVQELKKPDGKRPAKSIRPGGEYSPGISGIALNTNIDINVGGDLAAVGCEVFDLCDVIVHSGDWPKDKLLMAGAPMRGGKGQRRGPQGAASGGVFIQNVGAPDVIGLTDGKPGNLEHLRRTGITTYGEGSPAISGISISGATTVDINIFSGKKKIKNPDKSLSKMKPGWGGEQRRVRSVQNRGVYVDNGQELITHGDSSAGISALTIGNFGRDLGFVPPDNGQQAATGVASQSINVMPSQIGNVNGGVEIRNSGFIETEGESSAAISAISVPAINIEAGVDLRVGRDIGGWRGWDTPSIGDIVDGNVLEGLEPLQEFGEPILGALKPVGSALDAALGNRLASLLNGGPGLGLPDIDIGDFDLGDLDFLDDIDLHLLDFRASVSLSGRGSGGVVITNYGELRTNKDGSNAIQAAAINGFGGFYTEGYGAKGKMGGKSGHSKPSQNGGVSIYNNAKIKTRGENSGGIAAVVLSDVRYTSGKRQKNGGKQRNASPANGPGAIMITNGELGRIKTDGDYSTAISAFTLNGGAMETFINRISPRAATVEMDMEYAPRSMGDAIHIENYGKLTTFGQYSDGIYAEAGSQAVVAVKKPKKNLKEDEKSTAKSANGKSDRLPDVGGVRIINYASIKTKGSDSSGIVGLATWESPHRHSVKSKKMGGGKPPVMPYRPVTGDVFITTYGEVQAENTDSAGIVAISEHGGVSVVVGNSMLNPALAARGSAQSLEGPAVYETELTRVQGGSKKNGAGVVLDGYSFERFENHGIISAENYRAVTSGDNGAHIANWGTLKGFVELNGGSDVIYNYGTFLAKYDSTFDTDFHDLKFKGKNGPGGKHKERRERDRFNNSGTVALYDVEDKTDHVTFFGLENFDNSYGGVITLQNGEAGDTFRIAGNRRMEKFRAKTETVESRKSNGGNFVGGGTVELDVDLGDDDSNADMLIIDGKFFNGDEKRGGAPTAVVISDTLQSGGAETENGIKIIDVTNSNTEEHPATKEGDFFLPGGSVSAGFFDYNLKLEEGAYFLQSTCNENCQAAISQSRVVQENWHSTANPWRHRVNGLRDGDEGDTSNQGFTITPTAAIGPRNGSGKGGFWARLIGEYVEVDTNTDYNQTSVGIQTGIDTIIDLDDDGMSRVILGILGGYSYAGTEFAGTATRSSFDGGTVGAYVSLLYGQAYLDVLFKADIGTLEYNVPAAGAKANLDADSIGVSGNLGYRFNLEGGAYIDPRVGLSYVNSDIQSGTVGGAVVNFASGESLRLNAGGRLGWRSTLSNGSRLETYIEGTVYHEFEGDNSVNIANFNSVDSRKSTWGEAGAGVILQGNNNVTGILDMDVLFGGDVWGISGTGTVRFNF